MTDLLYMQLLVDDLNKASEAYYGSGQEIMSDYEWNAKFDELEALEEKLGIVLDNSPTHNVSHESSNGRIMEKHEYPALSLPKSKDFNDLIKWANDKKTVLSWKLDGLTLVVTYDDGKLSKVVKRGDGEYGINITHLAPAIHNLPKTIDYKGHLVIRGEAVISYDDFRRINDECDNVYKNPRNLASGTCNFDSPVEIMDRNLIWIPFTLVHIDTNINSWVNRMNFLKLQGFETVEFTAIDDVSDIKKYIDWYSGRVDETPYPVDGLVLVYDDTDYASKGTFTGHHDTRGGFAFKWEDEVATTKLQRIDWSVSIHSINPVAVFDPVELEDTTVKRASLCNISECERLGIGGEGTELNIIKANKIIPKVVSANGFNCGKMIIPDVCPVCGAKTAIKESLTTKVLICTNSDCPAKNISKMERFVGKHGFDIRGLSGKKLMQLVNLGIIKNPVDIFRMLDKKDEVIEILSNIDGWGGKSIDNLLSAISDSKNVKAANLLYSLCIPMCGRDVSKKLTKSMTLEDILATAIDDSMNDTVSLGLDIDGIGDVKINSFVQWFKSDTNVEMIEDLLSICTVDENVNDSSSDTLSGKTFVITGSLNNYENRDILKALIESMGGKVSGSVSKKTTYLINNDVNSTSGKNKKAKELNVPIISEQDFIDMFLN